MVAAAKRTAPSTQCYQRRRPEQTLWYRTVQSHFETWLELSTGEFNESPPAHVENAFRRYLECGILARGFARAHCDECGHDFLIAFSCKGRGVCPSCNTRRMVETAAHLADHVFPKLPVRQWVLSVPKRLRYFLQRDVALQGDVLRIFLREVERCLRERSPGCDSEARIGAVAFIHRFGCHLTNMSIFIAASSMGHSSQPLMLTMGRKWIFMQHPGLILSPSPKCKHGYGGGFCALLSVAA